MGALPPRRRPKRTKFISSTMLSTDGLAAQQLNQFDENSRFEIDKEPEPASRTENDEQNMKARKQSKKHSESDLVMRQGRRMSIGILGSDKEDDEDEERNYDLTVFEDQSKDG